MSVVITAHDQGLLVAEAVASAWTQSRPPQDVIVVDDGSTDPESLRVLGELSASGRATVIHQTNAGVSAARNAGLAAAGTELVVVLDGDDRISPAFVERTVSLLESDPAIVAASAFLKLHGVVDAVVRPTGGTAADFLHRNACPATALVRRSAWQACGGYDESMRVGFEDWDFFLSILGTDRRIAIVPEPLVEYRTAEASANVRSMQHRLELYGRLIDKHSDVFAANLRTALLAHEAHAVDLLNRWEQLLVADRSLPVGEISYGDGGMAAAVRVASARRR